MASANSTSSPSVPTSPNGPDWALICAAHLDAALSDVRQTIPKARSPEFQLALCGVLAEAAKLLGVLEWLGEGLVTLPEGGAA